MNKEEILEVLANNTHQAWSSWMEWVFTNSVSNEDGTVTISKESVDKWKRQIETGYEDLTIEEQNSDIKEANIILDLLKEYMEK